LSVASLARSIKGAEEGSDGVEAESAESSSCGGCGQGGGWVLFLKVGSSEQGGVLGGCDWAWAGVMANASANTIAPAMQKGYCFTESP
jgi:hypothetical protein